MKLSGESANYEVETGSLNFNANELFPFIVTNTVNMRVLMGDMMFNKYKKFYIVFNSFGGFNSANTNTYTTLGAGSQNSLVWTLGMSGDLRFISNTVNGQPSNIGYFPMRFTLPINGYGFLNSPLTNGVVFEKPANDTVTINISPYLIRNGTIANYGGTTVGNIDFNFSFTIYGLEE